MNKYLLIPLSFFFLLLTQTISSQEENSFNHLSINGYWKSSDCNMDFMILKVTEIGKSKITQFFSNGEQHTLYMIDSERDIFKYQTEDKSTS